MTSTSFVATLQKFVSQHSRYDSALADVLHKTIPDLCDRDSAIHSFGSASTHRRHPRPQRQFTTSFEHLHVNKEPPLCTTHLKCIFLPTLQKNFSHCESDRFASFQCRAHPHLQRRRLQGTCHAQSDTFSTTTTTTQIAALVASNNSCAAKGEIRTSHRAGLAQLCSDFHFLSHHHSHCLPQLLSSYLNAIGAFCLAILQPGTISTSRTAFPCPRGRINSTAPPPPQGHQHHPHHYHHTSTVATLLRALLFIFAAKRSLLGAFHFI